MKYQISDEVEVNFIGTVDKIELKDGKIRYRVISRVEGLIECWAIDLTESQIYPLNEGEEK